jgi:predicted ATPase
LDILSKLTLEGFKSIQAVELELRPINILIGANGAGKSNLISFFKMLNEMMAGRLQQYIGTAGRAQSLLYFGPKTTPQIQARLEFSVEKGKDICQFRLFHAADDTLIFGEETLLFWQMGLPEPKVDALGAGHTETKINDAADRGQTTAKVLKYLLNRCRVYHFHDTSATAGIRQSCYQGDNRWLMPDAGNLAALLLRFQQEQPLVYRRIVETVRLVAPFFEDFVLEPDGGKRVMLNWQEKSSDRVFGPHQFSDGTLRAIGLIALLLQPEKELPKLIIVDEPELGLHPYALNVVADLIHHASQYTQILVSTQSSTFLDNFEPEDIVVVDREDRASRFRRFTSEELQSWLEEYSLGEVWMKNVLGGGPH